MSAKAQTMKTYNGEFDNGEATKAKATYTYYEDAKTHDYIKQGAFKYVHSFNNEAGSYNATFNGVFKNNLKDGVWTYVITETNCLHSDNLYYTGVTKLTATYSNGVPNGTWSYEQQCKRREKMLHNTWSNYESLPNEITKATFKNGHFAGHFETLNNPTFAEFSSITGNFDDNGNPTGNWILRNLKTEESIQLQNGIVCQSLTREVNSGKITHQEVGEDELSKIRIDISQKKLTKASFDSLKIIADTIKLVNGETGILYFGESFNGKFFKHDYIGGDATYFTKNYKLTDTRNYGYMVNISKSKMVELKMLKEYELSEKQFQERNFNDAYNNYKFVYNTYFDRLSKAEITVLLDKINVCGEKSKSLYISKEKFKEADLRIKKVSDWKSCQQLTDVKIALSLYNELTTTYVDFFKSEEINELKINHAKCSEYVQRCEEEKNTRQKLNSIIQKNNENVSALQLAFGVNIDQNGKITSIDKKQKLYNLYIDIYNELFSKTKTASNAEKLETFEKMVALETKIMSLINTDSKDIEKELKKAETINDKLKILGL